MTGPSELEEIRAVVRNWSVLIEPARKLFGGGLQSGGELEGLRLLQPATWGTPRFDRLRQELQWPIQDDRGATICLWLPFTATTEAAIPWLEKRAHATGTRVLGVVRLREARLLVEPVALHEDGHVVNLTLDMVSATSGPAGSTSQPDDREEDGIDTIDAEQLRSASNIGLLLASGLAELEGIAEAGLCASRDLARLRAVAQRTEALGLASCASSCRRFLDRMETIRRDMDAPRRDAARALVQAYHVFSLASAQEAVSSATAALTGSP